MRRFVVVVALVLLAAALYRSQGSAETATGTLTLPQPAPNVGDRAPRFEASGVGAEPFEVSEEGTYVLAFWSPLNADSSKAREQFEALVGDYEGADFAAVYVGEAPREGSEAPYTVLRDASGRLAGLYNVKRVPRTFVVHDGAIKLVQNGYHSDNQVQLRETLAEVLQQEARKDRRDT